MAVQCPICESRDQFAIDGLYPGRAFVNRDGALYDSETRRVIEQGDTVEIACDNCGMSGTIETFTLP